MLDLLILGGSIAGSTAAVYAARRKLDLKLIAPEMGGEIATTKEIENWPGINNISGAEFTQKIKEQLKYNNVPIELGIYAIAVEKKDNFFLVRAKNFAGTDLVYETKTVIIATGAKPKELGAHGEKEFFHRGVTYCATCDAPLFKNKVVVVAGGGNSAISSALMLGEIASQVYIINIHQEFKGETILIEKIKNHPKIKIISEAAIQKINGEKNVTSIDYKNKVGEIINLPTQGVFIHAGLRSNADFVTLVEKNQRGEIVADNVGRTSIPGIFAAGDVTNVAYKQIVVAAGMGCSSALAAIDYLNQK